MPTYIDKNGYERHSSLVHREKAYEQIYKNNRDKYPLPFSEYVIHHKDENKKNNNIDNLEILTPEEHERKHRKHSFWVILLIAWGIIITWTSWTSWTSKSIIFGIILGLITIFYIRYIIKS